MKLNTFKGSYYTTRDFGQTYQRVTENISLRDFDFVDDQNVDLVDGNGEKNIPSGTPTQTRRSDFAVTFERLGTPVKYINPVEAIPFTVTATIVDESGVEGSDSHSDTSSFKKSRPENSVWYK